MSHGKLLTIITFICFSLTPTCSRGQNDFKNLTWGMSSETVYKIISRDKLEKIIDINDNFIMVDGMLSNCKGWRMYHFVNDKLFQIEGTLYQPLMFMNCDAKLWDKYSYAKTFFLTLEEKGFKNRSESIFYDKKRIRIGESSPLVSKGKINSIEGMINNIEQKLLLDNPGLRYIAGSFIKLEFFNQRSQAFVYFPSPGTSKMRCNEKYFKQEPERRNLLNFTIEATNDIYDQLGRKAF